MMENEMTQFFISGGPIMWPLLILAVLVVALSVKKILDLFWAGELEKIQLESGINAIIFWGGISLVLGFFAHFYGVYQAMNAIARASDISPAIVAMGYAMSLTTIIFGLSIFLFSAVMWFLLRWRYKKLIRGKS
jgi:hypothetical protein